jgi:hypothetical protein
VRRATLVPGFRVSWAGQGHAGPPEGARGPGGQGCEEGSVPLRGPLGDVLTEGFAGAASASRGPPAESRSFGREPVRVDPPSRLPAGLTAFRQLSGDCRHRATRLQPNVARVATALLQSTNLQYSNLTVRIVRRGATGESPTEGSGLSRGGTSGGQGAAKRCAGLTRPPDGEFSEGTGDRVGAPFAPLSRVRP